MENLLTVQQAATILAVTAKTIYRMIDGGDLPAARIGTRAVRISPADLERVMTPANPASGLGQTVEVFA